MVGRARMQHADLGHVPAFGQHHAVRDDLDLAAGESGQRGIALGLGRRAVDVLAAHAGPDEFVADVDAVRDVDGEGDGLPALAVLVPVRDDVADQLGAIHAVGELGLDVVAVTGVHAAEIGIDRRVDARRHEEAAARSASRPAGHSISVSKMPPSPRPSPRHGVAVRPSSIASG